MGHQEIAFCQKERWEKKKKTQINAGQCKVLGFDLASAFCQPCTAELKLGIGETKQPIKMCCNAPVLKRHLLIGEEGKVTDEPFLLGLSHRGTVACTA